MKTKNQIKAFTTLAFLLMLTSAQAGIIYSNQASGSDITGDGSLGNPYQSFHTAYINASAGDTLSLSGTFTWTDLGELGDAAITGYTLSKNITIIGEGADQTFIQAASSANTADRCVFTIDHDITIEKVTIRYGYNTNQAENSGGITIMDNTRDNTVIINLCTISHNAVDNGTTTNYNFAGGIYLRGNTSFHPTITVTNSTFHDNSATGKAYAAGALYSMQSNTINIEGCTFYNNTGTDGSSFGVGYHNIAGAMGFFRFNTVKVTNSTFTGNTAETSGGAILSWYNYTYLTNNTIAGNSVTYASGKGGGVYAVFMQQSPGKLYLKNNIIANNTVNGSGEDLNFNTDSWASSIFDNGYNIIENYTGSSITLSGTGTITGEQPSLNLSGTLALNNSGTGVETLALQSGSIAINAGSATANDVVSVPTTDQRGAGRASTTDIGAFEFGGTGLPIELISFDVRVQENEAIELFWKTATEYNNDHFEVFRSVDGVSWELIATEEGAGFSTSEKEYSTLDRTPHIGANYYTLKQVDFDGKSEEFDPVFAVITRTNEMVVFPNPSKSWISVSGTEAGTYVILDVFGRKVSTNAEYSPGEQIDISALTPGAYTLYIAGKPLRFVKMK